MQPRFFDPISAGLAMAGLFGLTLAATAEEVTIADLEGTALQAEIGLDQTVRREGRTVFVKVTQRWTLNVDPDRTVSFNMDADARTPLGTRKAEPARGTFTLDEPRQVPNRGGGQAVWKFADGTLTLLRTFPAGAYRVSFAFQRAADGLTCAVDAGYARENGRGPIRLQSPFGGGEVTIVHAKQVSSRCPVGKPTPTEPRDEPAAGGRPAKGG
jgi:hypothetical protein